MTPGLPFWPAPSQALVLVASLRQGLQQIWHFITTPLLEECEDDIHTPEMGTWESPKLQSSILGVKTPRPKAFFMSLEIF